MGATSRTDPTVSAAEELDGNASVLSDFDRIEGIFSRRRWATQGAIAELGAEARERALERLAVDRGAAQARATLLAFAAELLGALVNGLEARPRQAAELLQELEVVLGVPRTMLAREALRSAQLMKLEPAKAIAVQLALLLMFAPLRSVSLWTVGASGRVQCVHSRGHGGRSGGACKLARALIAGAPVQAGERTELLGLQVSRSQPALAGLVGRAAPRRRAQCRALMRETLPALAFAVERDSILKRNAAGERALVQTAERRLTRLGFDLHDGPLQDVALLGQDLRLFGDQLQRALGASADRELLRGRLEDLDAQLVELEAALRRVSCSVHASVLTNRPFSAAAQSLVDAFAARTGIEPRLTLRGDMRALSASQRIALLNIVQEALNNIREHSHASEVTITVCCNANGVEARVFDNGRGFNVEAALVSAARRGHMGLAGAHERARLLGGQCGIASKPGGPTTISIVLPRWQPLAAGPDEQSPAR